MIKNFLKFQLQISFIKEGDQYVAYIPALDLSTSGHTLKQAQKMVKEIADIFFDECIKKGVLKEVLRGLGWRKTTASKGGWIPPQLISQESMNIHLRL